MADDISVNYRDTYTDPFASQRKSTKTTNQTYDLVFTDKADQSVSVDDFLNLMVMQMTNQDFLNPMDDTQMVAQLAQFATMQQMQELAEYSKSNYVSSLLGKTVTASKFTVSGATETQTGPIQKISLVDNEYTLTVNGVNYSLSQIMEMRDSSDSELKFDASSFTVLQETVTDSWAEIRWPETTTDEELLKTLKYSVYYSTENNLNSVEDIEANGTLSGEANRVATTSDIVMGLEPNTTYYINVMITDASGNKTAYRPLVVRTEESTGE